MLLYLRNGIFRIKDESKFELKGHIVHYNKIGIKRKVGYWVGAVLFNHIWALEGKICEFVFSQLKI